MGSRIVAAALGASLLGIVLAALLAALELGRVEGVLSGAVGGAWASGDLASWSTAETLRRLLFAELLLLLPTPFLLLASERDPRFLLLVVVLAGAGSVIAVPLMYATIAVAKGVAELCNRGYAWSASFGKVVALQSPSCRTHTFPQLLAPGLYASVLSLLALSLASATGSAGSPRPSATTSERRGSGPRIVFAALALLLIVAICSPLRVLYIVWGTSMLPTLRPLDIVIAVPGGAIAVGKIVVVDEGGKVLVHRVVAVRNGSIVTKGDNNRFPDPPAPLSRVRGVVVAVVPREAWIGALSLAGVGALLRARKRFALGSATRSALALFASLALGSTIVANLAAPPQPLASLARPPLPDVVSVSTNLSRTAILLELPGAPLDARCSVGGYPAPTEVVGGSGTAIVVARLGRELAAELLQEERSVAIECSIAFLRRGALYEYRFSLRHPIPLAKPVLRVEVENGSLALVVRSTPFSLPIPARIVVLPGSTTVKAVLEPGKKIVLGSAPRGVAVVRIAYRVAGRSVVQVLVARPAQPIHFEPPPPALDSSIQAR